MRKVHIGVTALMLTMALLVVGCSGTPAATTAGPTASTTAGSTVSSQTAGSELQLTLEELSQYTGQNGKPAYIAVDGVIYDVTNVPQWKNGGHNGFSAGKDLTKEIKTVSPHGISKLNGVPALGKLKP